MSMTQWLESLFFALLRASWQASVLILLVLGLRWILRKTLPAEWRFWFWILVLIRLALPFSLESPLSIFNFSRLNVPATLRSQAAQPAQPPAIDRFSIPAPQLFETVADLPSTEGLRATNPEPPPNRSLIPALSPRALIPFVWGFGVLILTVRVFLAHRRLASRLRRESPAHDPYLVELVDACAREIGLRRAPQVIETTSVHSPGIFGVFAPKLLLPASAAALLTPFQLRCVILHELCHLRRRDVCLNWLTTALQILHWFNPLVWLAASRFRADRELACDALTLGHLEQGDMREYGRTILRLIENCAAYARVPSLVGIGDNLGHLKFRLAMISRFARRPLRWVLLAGATALLLGLVTLTDAQGPGGGTGRAGGMHLDMFLFQGCTSARPACACDPSPAVKSAIEKATPSELDSMASGGQLQRKIQELQALTQQYPREVAVHQAYQRAVEAYQRTARQTDGIRIDTLLVEYRSLAQKHPDDAFYQYLYGQFLVWRDRAEARRYLLLALERDANFPWPHLALGRLDAMEHKRDEEIQHLRTFLDKCPCSLEAYSLVIQAEPAEQALQDIAKMRALLRQNPVLQLGSYLSLWDTELELTPIPDQPTVRKAIAGDLAELRRLNRVDLSGWWTILQEGYKRAWDQKNLDWARSERARQLQSTPLGFQVARQNWLQGNPPPMGNSEPAKRDAYLRARLEAGAGWVKQWPDDFPAWLERFNMLNTVPGTADADIDAAIEGMLQALEKNPGSPSAVLSSSQVYLSVASSYAKRGVHLDRVPALVDKALQAAASAPNSSPNGSVALNARWQAWGLSVEALLGLKQADKARTTVSEMEALLAKNRDALSAPYWETQLHYYQGRLAEGQKRTAEAVSLYQSVLRDRARRGETYVSRYLMPQPPDPLIAQAAALWKELRRPETGWQSFLTELEGIRAARIKETTPKWQNAQISLPDFRLADAKGKVWQLADLKGKTCFIHVWAVWSSRGNENLKPIQELYNRLKDRPDILFLTLNADQYTPQIEPFLKDGGYTLPVIPAYRYVQSFKPFTGSGQSWIVDPGGNIRRELKGTISGADAVDEAIAQVDQVIKEK
jgi:beta-lactamase regulating signal transducer with metallopeptidase domain